VFGTIESQALPAARVILPVTNVAEEQGTFVNRDGRVQRYQQARSAPGMGRPAWWITAEVQRASATTPSEAFAQVASGIPELAGVTYGDLGLTGRMARAAARSGV
jgi:NADH-quinone oxidoreductase subunit G